MKKTLWCLCVVSMIGLSVKIATADEHSKAGMSILQQSEECAIRNIYENMDVSGAAPMSFDAFRYAYRGYMNLLAAKKLGVRNHILTIIDFSLSSREKRMWILDMEALRVVLHEHVAHGQGSGEEYARVFSNKMDSHQSSLGFYTTGLTYEGEHGTSLQLHGLDAGFNSLAFERAIVIHGADYVSPQFICNQKRLGRSWGCPAVSERCIRKVIDYLQNGTCLFIYYPHRAYLTRSKWAGKPLDCSGMQTYAMDTNKGVLLESDHRLSQIPRCPAVQVPASVLPPVALKAFLP